jgi:energy-coupling factor transport system substrate-specific component
MSIVDFMTIGVFFVINLVAGVMIAFIGVTPVTYVMIAPLQAIILGIPMMLFLSKVRKPGMLLVFGVLTGLVGLLMSLGPYGLASGVVLALVGELVLRGGDYKSVKRSVLAYAFMSSASTATYIPLFFATEAYLLDADVAGKYGVGFSQGLADIGQMGWVLAVIVVVTFLCGILGGLLGQRVFNKHFRRAGIV